MLVTEVIGPFGCGLWVEGRGHVRGAIDEVFTKHTWARYHAGSWGRVGLRETGRPEGSSGGLSEDEPRGGCEGVLSAPDTRGACADGLAGDHVGRGAPQEAQEGAV